MEGGLLQKCYRNCITEMLRNYYGIVTKLLRKCYEIITKILQKCYKIITEILRVAAVFSRRPRHPRLRAARWELELELLMDIGAANEAATQAAAHAYKLLLNII